MLKIIICGINGTLGELVYNCAIKNGHHVTCGIDKITVGKTDCPVYNAFDQVRDLADVIIDFSSPTAIDGILAFAKDNSLPLVLGTTGYDKNQEQLITNASEFIPIFKSANMSLGINALLRLCRHASSILQGYDVEIIEKHHNKKNDAPSGTTHLIYDALTFNKAEKPLERYGRKGFGKRQTDEIGIHSVRGGSLVGEHSVLLLGNEESITLTHTAHSKTLFAIGAIKASEFIVKKKRGLYCMDDLI